MSKSSSVDKYEPIKLETTILKIDIKTNGDLITKDYDLIPFHPNMSDMKDLSNNNYVLFPSFVKITMKYLKSAGVGQDFKKVFTQLDKYIDLIKFVTSPKIDIDEDNTLLVDQTQYKNYALSFVQDFTTDITSDFREVQKYGTLTEDEIITNNIGIIKSIFLPANGRFFVLGHEYIINESKYLPPYKGSSAVNQKLTERKQVPLNYNINIELQLLDVALNPGIGDFDKLSCKQKKINLNKDVKEIFGETFGYKEEEKATIPSLIPTTTSKRGFGKLQLEWEERNKYVKAALTESERLAQEKGWTALQKKMNQLDKYQEEYNKIPPLWLKENKDSDDKKNAFESDMKKYVEEIVKIKEVNAIDKTVKIEDITNTLVKDLIDAVKTKMKDAIIRLGVVEGKTPADSEKEINKIIDDFISGVASIDITAFFNNEKTKIDEKYVKPFLTDMIEKKKDVDELTKQEAVLQKEIEKMQREKKDTYNINAKQEEKRKLQAILLTKQTDYKVFERKYGEKGATLTSNWRAIKNKMDVLKDNITNDKNTGEQKILNDSVTSELKTKMDEIKLVKENLLKANYFAGNYEELTRSEGDSYSKKPGSKPIENVDLLKKNLDSLKEEYLEIAKKLGPENEMQSYITLLNEDLERIKNLKKGKEKEKTDKDKEAAKISTELEKISKQKAVSGSSSSKDVKSEKEMTLNSEEEKLQKKIKPLIEKIDAIKNYEKQINEKIIALKKLNKKDEIIAALDKVERDKTKKFNEDFVRKIQDIDTAKAKSETDTTASAASGQAAIRGGKKLTTKRRQHKKKKKTNKKIYRKNKSLRKHRKRERKYTRRTKY
jgi:hypothetical protein